MGLKVGVLGTNTKMIYQAIKQIAESDVYSIVHINAYKAIMSDGTEYIAIYPGTSSVRGYKLDQLIVVDDARWNIFAKLGELIDKLRQELLFYSCVPEEFQIQKFEW